MPSWQARLLSAYMRAAIRRADWGDERTLAKRARRVFGAPGPVSRAFALGLNVTRVRDGTVRGEWIAPRAPADGVVLYVHGGGYISCSPASHRTITAALARLTRRRVFAVEYRLAPEHRFPCAIDDVVAAYRWLLAQGIPPQHIALDGDSAGGGLVLALLSRARREGLPLPACAVMVSPWTDLSATGASQRTNEGRDAMFFHANMAQFARAYLGDASPDDPDASPVHADLAGFPPLLLQVGSTELLLDDARRVHERALGSGVSSTLDIVDDVPHGWQMLVGFVPEATTAMRDAAEFVERHLGSA